MSKLHIAKDLALPLDAVTQKLAFLGRTGSGKTYAASKVAEEMVGAGAQVIALDPVGVWYGLRVAADGKSPGIQIPVFGGLHGDVPIEHTGGKLIADLLVDRHLSAVVDVSQFESDAQKARFAGDFADRFFFRKKAAPSPVMLFLEEAQEFIPENPQRDEATMLHYWTRLAKLGRNFGIGLAPISQRPQEVNKKVLNLTECMFAFQMTGPHERKTIKSWVEEKGGDLDIVDALPKFAVGQAHVWSPQWLRISETITIAKKWTFNSSSTPAFGSAKRTEPKPLDSADMERITQDMAATIERAKATDPRELQKQLSQARETIKRLEEAKGRESKGGELKTGGAGKELKAEDRQKAFERGVQAERKRIRGELSQQLNGLRTKLRKVLPLHITVQRPGAEYHFASGSEILTELDQAIETVAKSAPVPEAAVVLAERVAASPSVVHRLHTSKPAPRGDSPPDGTLGVGERKLLIAAAQQDKGATRVQLSILGGYKRSTRDRYVQTLQALGYVSVSGANVAVTEAGLAALGSDFEPLPTGKQLRDHWLQKLPEGESRLLRLLVDAKGKPVDKDSLSEQTGYKRSTRDRYLQSLTARKLAEPAGTGMIRASDELFEKYETA